MQPGGSIWFGAVVAILAALLLGQGLYNGEFYVRWPFAPADREHPGKFWTVAALHVGSFLFGVYCLVCGLIGVKPFS
jgi:hypothetical protein